MARQPKSSSKAPQKPPIGVEDLVHTGATRKNIPTAEHQSVMDAAQRAPRQARYPRANARWLDALCALHEAGEWAEEGRPSLNRELDPQLIWRGKDQQDWSDLIVNAPPLYIQEKVKPKALIDDLRRLSQTADNSAASADMQQAELFGDFNGLPEGAERTDFYQHEGHWQNRLILGDSLQVMASLAEREGLRGQVQCIYFDPPYGIKFNSNFQWSTTSRDVKDGNASHITREPEQVKAFRDTWRDGIHSYLSYLRDRLMVARDLLSETGSIFVQIGDENVHRVRAVMDEVFGEGNCISQIAFRTTTGRAGDYLSAASNYLIWFAKDSSKCKYRAVYQDKSAGSSTEQVYSLLRFSDGSSTRITSGQKRDNSLIPEGARLFRPDNITSSRPAGDGDVSKFVFNGKNYTPGKGTFKTDENGLARLSKGERIWPTSKGTIQYIRYLDDFPVIPFSNVWTDTGTGSFTDDKVYVVQTGTKVIERCLLMASDPGDLVLDPTCGSGTTAYVAEQWGRRWITIDTSRVALALARARIMGARYPYYLLADSREGQLKEAEISQSAPSSLPVYGHIAHGFVCQRVPHITLKSIANNAEIDVIWDQYEAALAPLRAQLTAELTAALPKDWLAAHRKAQKYTAEVPAEIQEWEVPRDYPEDWPASARALHEAFWQQRIARQKAIDASIAAKADFETLYDKPYEDKKRVRVAGPFTVESLNPHRELGVDEEDRLIDRVEESRAEYGQDFAGLILENLRAAGVQQAHKSGKIEFTALTPWPGQMVCAEGRYDDEAGETGASKRAGIFIGPEFGTVTRVDLADAAREAGEAGFDVLIACAFNYDAQASEFDKLGRVRVLKARMNADLHMAEDLKNTGKGNLFVIFGEPDVDVLDTQGRSIRRYDGKQDIIDLPEGKELVVKIRGVDVFDPASGEVRSDSADGIACWFLDTNYNEESFFVRHAYFLGAGDPYKALKTTLKADINPEAWASLNSDTSRPFPRPETGRFAVKVINHLGDEVMKVFKVG
ncbi:site-specific DNA-methyltransferase [Comamonadaceae bacterium OH2545_COT-014]|nr:site-specific DNA-methyltransferase [Comamonadaceae bacterium OH2545_COT-014]